jgi:glyceraldehyde 3-phosphate dehydrogenase
LVIPELEGRLNGFAVRVPLTTGSLVDLTIEAQRETTAEAVNEAFARRADRDALEGILAYTQEPIVSTDIVGSSYSATFDAGLTSVIDRTQVKVIAWCDNEWDIAPGWCSSPSGCSRRCPRRPDAMSASAEHAWWGRR